MSGFLVFFMILSLNENVFYIKLPLESLYIILKK